MSETTQHNQAAPRKVLSGQTAIVTGANSGLGEGIAIGLGEAGADVAVNYITNPEAAEKVAEKIRSFGSRAITVYGDVSSEDDVAAMFDKVFEEFGTLDILVNNAGLQQDALFHEMTLAQWQKVIDVNLTGQFLCARLAVRHFLERGIVPERSCSAGKIINISSVHEMIPWAGHINYAASKGGVMLLTRSLAQEVAPKKIRVNAICPGAIRTPINTHAWEDQEQYDELLKLIPYKRIGETTDVAKSAVFLASDDSDYINGHSMYVDGGMMLYPEFAEGE